MALAAWGLDGAACAELPSGHINRTWQVDAPGSSGRCDAPGASGRCDAPGAPDPGGRRFVLQWLNPIFAPEVHEDIEAVTARLAQRGLLTPRLVRTRAGALWATDADGGVWRLFTFVPGETRLVADTPARCAAAGGLLGAFHAALWDFEHTYRCGRLGVHDTPRHLAGLRAALAEHARHPEYAVVAPLAAEILAAAADLPLELGLPLRHVHGDPKISNVRFAGDGAALCLVDLDTLARMPIAVELGDAFRSWCNPAGEEVAAPFRVDFFAAGLAGYAAALGDRARPEERAAVPLLVETIAVELAARFCADALRESYFGWDRRRFARAAHHNLLRASSQLALGRSIRAQRAALEAAVRAAWR
jgi:Ser/Thr protein kinase RdoA (MazF antagonist)